MRVDWTNGAIEQLDEIAGGRAKWSEESAKRLRAAIIDRADNIVDFPHAARMIPEFQMEHLREVLEQGFRVMYEVFEDRIEVFGVVSSRRDVFRQH